jgi:trans-aconitate 2-methyltransferase
MTHPTTSHYTFGDNDLAAARLERLALAYAPSSTAFLRCAIPRGADHVVDLGAGLGITTQLLSELTQARHVVGYERSSKYVQLAKARFPLLDFREVDVLLPPYPDRDVDAFYSRFLLTHLHEPERVIEACLAHLRPGGRLLLEETCDLSSPIAALGRYYAAVAEMQAHYGQELYIGQRLSALVAAFPDARVTATRTSIPMPASTMATLHAMNIATWKRDPFMLETHGIAALEELESALTAIAQSNQPKPDGCSVMAQVLVEKR